MVMDVKIQALQKNTPLKRKGLSPCALFKPCSLWRPLQLVLRFRFDKRLGKTNHPFQNRDSQIFPFHRNPKLHVETAEPFIGKIVRLHIRRSPVQSATYIHRFALTLVFHQHHHDRQFCAKFSDRQWASRFVVRPPTTMQEMRTHRRIHWEDLQRNQWRQKLRRCARPWWFTIISEQPRSIASTQRQRKPRCTSWIAPLVQEPSSEDYPVLFTFRVCPKQLSQKWFPHTARQLPVTQTKLVTNEDTSCCNQLRHLESRPAPPCRYPPVTRSQHRFDPG